MLSTTGYGVDVFVSVGRGVTVRVNVGKGVKVSVDGMAVNVAVDATPVEDGTSDGAGAEATGPPPETLQARIVRMSRGRMIIDFCFTP